jgi:hypothetical protein
MIRTGASMPSSWQPSRHPKIENVATGAANLARNRWSIAVAADSEPGTSGLTVLFGNVVATSM